MSFRELLSVLAGLIMLYGFIPYARDIVKGKVKPARAARLMFVLLLIISLFQQQILGSDWLLAITIGDSIGAIAILILSLKRGVGGLARVDRLCYIFLFVDIAVWVSTGNALLALHLSVLADMIAMTPTLVKTWHQPWTETPLFFLLGFVGPLLNIIAVGHYSYAVLLFPAYIGIINLAEALLIITRQHVVPLPSSHTQLNHQPLI